MKILNKALIAAVTSAAIVASAFISACGSNLKSYVQQLNYTESIQKINNPDQGFYRPVYVKLSESGATYNKNIVSEATQLYHLRIDISEFSAALNGESSRELTKDALNGFDGLLSYIRTKDKNALVRFAYDPGFNGGKDKEPDLQTMLRHVAQVCSVINNYPGTVTAVEAGLIGPWGEMHSSAVAKPENISRITEAFLSGTQTVPVLVRTPKMLYDYLGITLDGIEGFKIADNDKAYRLGIFNDGYLGSANDLGTYTDRQKEVEFLSGQTAHLPYGGEVVVPSSNLHDIERCLPEMHKLNLNYLNAEWNDSVIAKWKNSFYTSSCGTDEKYYGATAFDYIQNRLGYRFVLTNSVLKYSQTQMRAELSLKNVGFGNLNKVKKAKLIFTDGDGKAVYSQSAEDFHGGDSYVGSVELKLESGEYDVYLRLYGEESDNIPLYCLQFANDGLWNAELKANKIGTITMP